MLNQGDKFGKYTIVKRIGVDERGNSTGAFATVYLVCYKDKEFVLKIPNNQERVNNLLREIGNWARVSLHPNILTFHEAVSDDGKIGFISEYIETGSLKDWLKNSANLTISDKLAMIDGILSGLEHLHENSILHRDLKPDNVFVKNGIPLLADFGSAKDYDFAESQHAYGFTYWYAPPELIAIYDEFGVIAKYQLTEFDDLWSVSVIISEILTGQYPFERMSKIMSAEIRPFPPNIDPNHLAFIQKALQKNRENRFQSIKEMREALQSSAQIVVEKTEDAGTIIDEDFDKTKKLEVEPTQDWRAIEAEKERQRQLAEAQRRQAEEEAKRIAALEAQRRQAELEEIQRKLAQNSNQSSSNLWKWAVGGLSGFVVLLLGIIGINSLSNNNSTVGNATNRPANSASNKPAAKTSTTPAFKNSIGMEFVLIPSGTFMMGSPTSEKDRDDDETQHQVTISKSFYMGKYEVTQEEYEKVTGTNPSNFKNCPRCPVENVSWEDVQDFIRKLNTKGEGRYRLPTEAEWEYAARAGSTARYSYGDGEGSLGNYAWYSANSGSKTHEVGTKQPNEWGLYDMHGNVWEWCGDWYGAYSSSAQIDPTGATSGSNRVCRGGSWGDDAVNLRSANRGFSSPSNRYDYLGFRVVRE